MSAETDTLKAAIKNLEEAQHYKITPLVEIKEGFKTMAELLYDGAGECAPGHQLTERQQIGLIFAAQVMAYCMGGLIDDLEHMLEDVLKVLPPD